MNNTGQIGLIGLIFSLIIFVILWALYIGKWLSEWGRSAITTNGLTGLEAFFMANLNLWVVLGLIIGVMAWVYIGGGQR